ncbi:hypothetical protein [Flagellimonas lutimaris]|uniref:hypothetical protein n=1 Tax=Flagellimonas lutimaris TaxID=475082 RepID=UPI003F5CE294
MKIVYRYLVLIMTVSLFSCGGGGSDDPDPIPNVPAPTAVTLVFPDNNEECTESIVISVTESKVTFQWSPSENTDSYTVNLRNLESGTQSSSTTTNTEMELTLNRGTAYSWTVVSAADGTNETATSNTWRFYNAGAAIENYAPFPAYNPYPEMGVAVDEGNINLEWEGADLDGDTLSYTLYMDTVSPPAAVLGETDTDSYETTIEANMVYYWKVVTMDSAGNSSESEIFEFRTNP